MGQESRAGPPLPSPIHDEARDVKQGHGQRGDSDLARGLRRRRSIGPGVLNHRAREVVSTVLENALLKFKFFSRRSLRTVEPSVLSELQLEA
jgi:hypothetical protein